jgi:hypothetical protein
MLCRLYSDVKSIYKALYHRRYKIIFACLNTLRHTSKLNKIAARYNGQDISATSESYGGTEKISSATLTAEGSTYFTQFKDIHCCPHVPHSSSNLYSISGKPRRVFDENNECLCDEIEKLTDS